uniref:Ribosomal protein L31 n=1 Tax=Cryptomonas curvata TaxID=233186 RepID=A0A2P1G8J4_9CRYP|nr:ribosomal protein L31 [Cryptomonas curvata]AVM81246.1 ribosomal protein L31 [Cryptomonas curvata]
MNESKHLKKKKTLIQFSDGSSCHMFFYTYKKESLVESDIKSNLFWKHRVNTLELESRKSNLLYYYNKLFIKTK